MSDPVRLIRLLAEATGKPDEQLARFALVVLGIIESLEHGLMSASDAVRLFFHADNCLFVRKQWKDKAADQVMSHGVQLPDLFEALSTEEAHREFLRELAAMRALCLKLLDQKRRVA